MILPLRHRLASGFTMIEMIGVLAVISILAATIAPSAIQMITSSKQSAEDSALTAIADAFRLHVQNSKKIPSETTWATDLASLMNTSAGKVTKNGNNGSRIYLYPQDFFTQGHTTPSPLAYDQYAAIVSDAAGGTISKLPTTSPYNARVMVISNLNPGTPLTQASGSIAATTFNNIWNQTGTFPAELTEGDLLKIARINLSDLFEKLVLNNNDSNNSASYKLSGVTMPTIATGSQVTLELIKNTQLDLLDSYGNIYNRHVVNAATSFSYLSTWGGTLGATGGSSSNSSSNTGISSVTNSNGNFNQWSPSSSCTTSNNYELAVSNANNYKYWLYYGDANGNVIAPVSNANSTNCNKKQKENKIDKGDNTCNFTIPECSMVVVVPEFKAQNNNTTQANPAPSLLLFYMPSQNTTKSLP